MPGALGSPFVLLLACLAAARGPGRRGLRRCRQGGLACRQAIVSEGQEAGQMPGDAGIRAAGISGSRQGPARPPPRLPAARLALSARLSSCRWLA